MVDNIVHLNILHMKDCFLRILYSLNAWLTHESGKTKLWAIIPLKENTFMYIKYNKFLVDINISIKLLINILSKFQFL
jgi:hypothetical protein